MPDREAVDAALAAAVEADLVEHVARLHESPFGEVHREGGTVWFLTGRAEPHANAVLRADLAVADPMAEVARLLAPFRSRALPLMWWVFAPVDGPPSRVRRALEANGLVPDSDRPGMGMELASLRRPPTPEGASVARVRDEHGFAEWAVVVGRAFEDDAFSDSASVRAGLAMGFGDHVPFRHFVCRIGGEPVGASTLSTGAGVAGLANIATLPEHRGRGIGVAVAAAALEDAIAQGLRLAALSADQAGIRVYEKLGFHAVSRHLTYVAD